MRVLGLDLRDCHFARQKELESTDGAISNRGGELDRRQGASKVHILTQRNVRFFSPSTLSAINHLTAVPKEQAIKRRGFYSRRNQLHVCLTSATHRDSTPIVSHTGRQKII